MAIPDLVLDYLVVFFIWKPRRFKGDFVDDKRVRSRGERQINKEVFLAWKELEEKAHRVWLSSWLLESTTHNVFRNPALLPSSQNGRRCGAIAYRPILIGEAPPVVPP